MKIIIACFCSLVLAYACNNNNNAGEKDSVEIADSANKALLDSPAAPIQTNEAGSSFLVKAADGAMTEVHLGGLAQQKGKDPAVKDFGGMMIRDHSADLDKIKMLASQKNVVLPTTVSKEQQRKIDELTGKNGPAFDRAYINLMIDDHEADIKAYEKASDEVKDTDIKALVTNALPLLRTHLDSAKAIKSRLK